MFYIPPQKNIELFSSVYGYNLLFVNSDKFTQTSQDVESISKCAKGLIMLKNATWYKIFTQIRNDY